MVKFLLLLHCSDTDYANSAAGVIGNPLLCCLGRDSIREGSVRVVRMLIDAGADTVFEILRADDREEDNPKIYTLLELVAALIDENSSTAVCLSSVQIRGLQAIQRLIGQVDAARALSWGWVCAGDGGADSSAAAGCIAGATHAEWPAWPAWPVHGVPLVHGAVHLPATTRSRVTRQALFR